jgi:PKD repeat protein
VTFTANGVTGQSPLTYGWTLKNDTTTAPVGVSSSTGTLLWSDTSQAASGSYTATVTVANGSGNISKSVSVNLLPLVPLSFTGANGAPANDPFTAGTVQFHALALGASSWSWDFGDGQGFRAPTTDPVNGPNPSFNYAAAGTYTVQVKVSNCVQGAITSAPLTVHVVQTTPLIASFQAAVFCNLGLCLGTTGQAIAFADTSTGADHWEYDWNHSSSAPETCSFSDTGHTTPVTSHTYAADGTYYPCLRVRRGASEQNVFVHVGISVSAAGGGGGGGGGSPFISLSGVSSGSINQAYSYTATATNCTPSNSGWSWNTGGGTGSSTGSTISITWTTAGTKTISATNSGCSSTVGARAVTITDPNGGGGGGGGGGGPLAAKFTFTPPSPKPGDTVSFDGSSSTGSPTSYLWTFGDGSQASTAAPTHAYAAAGSYVVQLAVGAPATNCPFAPCVAQATVSQTIVVQGPPPFTVDYAVSGATCANIGGFDLCQAQSGQTVTLTATPADASSYQWTFGDGSTATGASVTHSWAAGTFAVAVTATKGVSTASKSRSFSVTGTPPPPPAAKEVVLPWIAQTRGALVQSSDLYVHNPSTNPMTVTLEFRKRGTPDTNPPQASKTIAPGATLYVADVLRELFNRENIAGFVSLKVTQGDTAPVITSYNTTIQADGKQFGQTIAGVSMTQTGSAVGTASGSTSQNLVGLISNSDRLAYFGVSNPGSTPATYHLRFFDKAGTLIGESSQDFTVSPFGQRQFQAGEIQSTFGISNQADYRVQVSTTSGGAALLPYASNLRLASEDPSFIEAGSAKNSKAYLLGVLSAPGSNNSLWRSDLLLSNTGTQPSTADVTFTSVGLNAVPTSPLHVTLQPGQTQRLENVVAGQLGVQNGIGVLTVSSASLEGVFPIVQGESYDNSVPTKRFGQSMAAMTDASAAVTGQSQYLAGLRQDASHRTTLWLFNPGSVNAQYDIIYRGLDGSVIGSTRGVILGAGKLRQFSPNQHPLPTAGVQDGFTVQIVVTSGKVLSAAQVVNNDTNDPSYIQGEAR